MITSRVIVFEDLKVGAEERFLLQALVSREPESLEVSFTVKKAAKQLGLTERMVKFRADKLLEVGLLISQRGVNQVGRPTKEYTYSPALRDRLAQTNQYEAVHRDLILLLFKQSEIFATKSDYIDKQGAYDEDRKPYRKLHRRDGKPAAPGAKGRLAASSRVLLAALLAHADHCGVVTGVSESRLREMTGLDVLSFKHHFKRLLGFGFIRSYVPGLSNAIFVGSKVSTTYYLNISHSQFSGIGAACGLILYSTDGMGELDRISIGLMSPAILAGLRRPALEKLRHILAALTSRLLLAAWRSTEEDFDMASIVEDIDVPSEINADWPMKHAKIKGDCWQGMRENFQAAACEWAKIFHKQLRSWLVWYGYRPELVRIIPAPYRGDGIARLSLVVYPAPGEDDDFIIIKNLTHCVKEIKRYRREEYLGFEVMLEYGLLTPSIV